MPEDLPDEAVAPLNCALAQVLLALRDVRLGDTVVIQGAGGLGINAVAVARTAGAAAVIVIDKIAGRLDVAADFGATHCIDASGISTAEVTEQVHKHTDGIGADWVLEVVGVPGVIPDGRRIPQQRRDTARGRQHRDGPHLRDSIPARWYTATSRCAA